MRFSCEENHKPSEKSWKSDRIPPVARPKLQDHPAWNGFFGKEKPELCHYSELLRTVEKTIGRKISGMLMMGFIDLAG